MAKGVPLMGRGPDGKAKIINVDENGNVKVQQSGRNVEIATHVVEWDGVLATQTVPIAESPYQEVLIAIQNSGVKSVLMFDQGASVYNSGRVVIPSVSGDVFCGLSKLTVECRFRPDTDPAPYQQLVGKHATGVGGSFFLQASDHRPQFSVITETAERVDCVSTTPVSAAEWHHIAGVYDSIAASDQIKLFVDGLPVAQASQTGVTKDNNIPISLGHFDDFNAAYGYKGALAEVRIWNIARTQSEIAASMDVSLVGNEPGLIGYWRCDEGVGCTVYDSTGNNNHGIASGLVSWGTMPDLIVTFEYEVAPGVWAEACDENGDIIVLQVGTGENRVIPVPVFPRFSGGRIRLTSVGIPQEGTTTVYLRGV
jgi:hypothetical protein